MNFLCRAFYLFILTRADLSYIVRPSLIDEAKEIKNNIYQIRTKINNREIANLRDDITLVLHHAQDELEKAELTDVYRRENIIDVTCGAISELSNDIAHSDTVIHNDQFVSRYLIHSARKCQEIRSKLYLDILNMDMEDLEIAGDSVSKLFSIPGHNCGKRGMLKDFGLKIERTMDDYLRISVVEMVRHKFNSELMLEMVHAAIDLFLKTLKKITNCQYSGEESMLYRQRDRIQEKVSEIEEKNYDIQNSPSAVSEFVGMTAKDIGPDQIKSQVAKVNDLMIATSVVFAVTIFFCILIGCSLPKEKESGYPFTSGKRHSPRTFKERIAQMARSMATMSEKIFDKELLRKPKDMVFGTAASSNVGPKVREYKYTKRRAKSGYDNPSYSILTNETTPSPEMLGDISNLAVYNYSDNVQHSSPIIEPVSDSEDIFYADDEITDFWKGKRQDFIKPIRASDSGVIESAGDNRRSVENNLEFTQDRPDESAQVHVKTTTTLATINGKQPEDVKTSADRPSVIVTSKSKNPISRDEIKKVGDILVKEMKNPSKIENPPPEETHLQQPISTITSNKTKIKLNDGKSGLESSPEDGENVDTSQNIILFENQMPKLPEPPVEHDREESLIELDDPEVKLKISKENMNYEIGENIEFETETTKSSINQSSITTSSITTENDGDLSCSVLTTDNDNGIEWCFQGKPRLPEPDYPL